MDGTREERLYHLQNWRGDVVRLISAASGGRQVEGARFSSYGVPWGIAKSDIDGDGDVDTDDGDFMLAWSGVPASYDVRGDFDLDGDVDMNDEIIFNGSYEPALGWGKLSNFASRKGYAGYEHDGNFDVLAHVRNRVYASDIGRWTRRDPAGFVDGLSLYKYGSDAPVLRTDPSGLRPIGPDGVQNASFTPFFDMPITDEDWCRDKLTPCIPQVFSGCLLPPCARESEEDLPGGSPTWCSNQCRAQGWWGFGFTDCELGCCICDTRIRNASDPDLYGPNTNPADFQAECTEAHEQTHLRFCEICPDVPEHCQHCLIDGQDLACLSMQLLRCGSDVECRNWIQARIDLVWGWLNNDCQECRRILSVNH